MNELEIEINPQTMKIIQALGGSTRLAILETISNGKDWTIGAIAKKIGYGKANVSIQISELERAGLITKRYNKIMGNNTKIVKPVYDKITIKLRK